MASIDPHVKQLGILAEKQMKSTLHARFLGDCRNDNVIPKGLRLKLNVSAGTGSENLQKSIDELLERVSFDICERIRDFHLCNSHTYSQMIEDKRKEMEKIVSSEKLLQIDETICNMTEIKKDTLLERHKKKLSSLKSVLPSNHATKSNCGLYQNSTPVPTDTFSSELTEVTSKRKRRNKQRTGQKLVKDKLAQKDSHTKKTAVTPNKTQGAKTKYTDNSRPSRRPAQSQLNNVQVPGTDTTLPKKSQQRNVAVAAPRSDNARCSRKPAQAQQKNVTAPSTRKTYLEAAKNGAMSKKNSTDLKEALETLTKVVADLLTATKSTQRKD